MIEKKSIKYKISNKIPVFGTMASVNMKKDELTELVENNNYDFVLIDGQHAPLNEDSISVFCNTANQLNIHVQFRIKHTNLAFLSGNYIDLGPSGIEIPQIELESTVVETLNNFYYPPKGVRSWGGQDRVGLTKKPSRLEYSQWWENYGTLWLQIESVNAVKNCRSFAKPGVDCLSFGPADLSFSMENNPDQNFKSIEDCVQFTVNQLTSTTTSVCFRNDIGNRQLYLDMGVTVLLETPKAKWAR